MNKKNFPQKAIGVLGGMGPESTAIYYQAVIQQCQRQFGAQFDEDYPEIFIYNLPIPDVVLGLQKLEETQAALNRGALKIQDMGADFLVMPCNTAHFFYPGMVDVISIPFICIFLATAKKIRSLGLKKIGFLSTETTINNQCYDNDFQKNGIELMLPNSAEQKHLTKIILNILAGKKCAQDKKALIQIIGRMQRDGAEGIVLACTDLPILLKQHDVSIPILDTVEILAEATVQYATDKIGNEILE